MQLPDDAAWIHDWRIQRRKSIQDINKLRRQLDNICVYCNYGKGVGRTVEIAGAATSVIGFVMAIGGYPLAPTVMNVGNLMQHSGALVEGALNATETFLSILYLREVQAVLERDQELFLPLMYRRLTSANLDASIQEFFSYDLASTQWTNLLKFFDQALRVDIYSRRFQTTFDLLKREGYSLHLDTDVKLEYLKQFTALINGNRAMADTMSILRILVSLLQIKVYSNLLGLRGPPELPSLREGIDPEIPTVWAVPRFCVFQAINIATNIVSLVQVVKVIRGEKSEYSHALQQLSYSLELELIRVNYTHEQEPSLQIHFECADVDIQRIGRQLTNLSDEFA